MDAAVEVAVSDKRFIAHVPQQQSGCVQNANVGGANPLMSTILINRSTTGS